MQETSTTSLGPVVSFLTLLLIPFILTRLIYDYNKLTNEKGGESSRVVVVIVSQAIGKFNTFFYTIFINKV